MGYVLNDGVRKCNELRGGSQEVGMVYTLGDQSSDCVVAECILASSTLVYSTIKLKLMDVKELQQDCCCWKCLHCFDEYDHYTLMRYAPILHDWERFYCNEIHDYVHPHGIKTCFKPL